MLQLASIFQTGMVLQRDKTVFVWGIAEQEMKVTVSIQNQRVETWSDADGRWMVRLNPLKASESEQMQVVSNGEIISLSDIAVGEVWVAGGQSNMEFPMRYEKHLSEVKENCRNGRVRFYDVPEVAFESQMDSFDYSQVGIWRKADPESIEYFSAVGYYFERELEKDLQVPVAIIGCNWGGSVSASWMNPETVKRVGPEWIEEYETFASKIDWDDYWKRQRTGIQNDRGDVFNPFSEFVMPRTPSREEVGAFFQSMAKENKLPDIREGELEAHLIPGAMYEHMVKKIAPYGIRGVLWYQGESDDEKQRAHLYSGMLEGLIEDWRTLWDDDSLPFLIVQLPGFRSWLESENHNYDLIRKAQQEVTDKKANTWLCCIGDVGEEFDIHPKNKLPVGERLALLARGHVYGENILCDAPVVYETKQEGRMIRIKFKNVAEKLLLEGDKVSALKVRGKDGFLDFKESVEGNTLVLQLREEVQPETVVEFATDDFYLVNLYNEAHIPATPFSIKL